MDLKGKMELVIVYRYGNVKFDKSCNNEEELKEFINELLKSVKEDLENGYSGDYEIIEVINNLGYQEMNYMSLKGYQWLNDKEEVVMSFRFKDLSLDIWKDTTEEELNKFKEFLKEHSIDRILKIDYHDNKVV